MPHADVFLQRGAMSDYRRACRYYSKIDQQLTKRFRLAVNEAIEKIAEDPRQWPKYDERTRWVKVRKFRYVLYFQEIDPERMLVVAVAHGSRRPGYWKRRLRG